MTERVVIEGSVDPAFQRQVAALANELKRTHEEGARIGQGPTGSSFEHLRTQVGDTHRGVVSFARGMAEATTSIAGGAAAAIAAGVAFGRLAAQGEMNARASAGVVGGYDAVARATMGTVTALGAYRAQQTLVNSGLRVSGDELAAVTRHAREHRDATKSVEEAVQEFTEALRNGESEGLRKYGIAVEAGATRAQTFEAALRQMREAAQGADPALRTMGESMTVMETGATEAATGFAALAAQGLGLNNVISNLSTDIARLGNDLTELAARRMNAERAGSEERERERLLEDVRQSRTAIAQTLREQGMSPDLLPGADQSLNRLNRQQLTEVAGTLASIRAEADPLRSTGADDVLAGGRRARNTVTGTVGSGPVESIATGLGANDAERALAAMRAARTGDAAARRAEARQLLETRLRNLLGQVGEAMATDDRRDRAAAPAAPAAPETPAAPAAANDNARAATRPPTIEELMGRAFERSGPRAELPPLPGEQTAAQLQASGEREREAVRVAFEARERKGREAAAREAATGNVAAMRRSAAESRATGRLGSEATLADLRDPAVQGEAERDHAMTSQIERERAHLDERLRVQEDFSEQWERLHRRQASATTAATDAASGAIDNFGKAFGKHVNAVLDGEEQVGEAAMNMVQEVITAIGQEAIVKAAMEFAEGVAAAAGVFTAPLAPGHFAAAAAYGAVGVAALGAGAIIGAARGQSFSGARPVLEDEEIDPETGKRRKRSGGSGGGSSPALPPPTQQDAAASEGGRSITIVYGAGILGSPRDLARHIRDTLDEGEQAGVRLSSRVVERAA